METIVDDLLNILSPNPKQYIVLAQVPWRIGFALSYRPTVALFLSWFVWLFDYGVDFLNRKSPSLGSPGSI